MQVGGGGRGSQRCKDIYMSNPSRAKKFGPCCARIQTRPSDGRRIATWSNHGPGAKRAQRAAQVAVACLVTGDVGDRRRAGSRGGLASWRSRGAPGWLWRAGSPAWRRSDQSWDGSLVGSRGRMWPVMSTFTGISLKRRSYASESHGRESDIRQQRMGVAFWALAPPPVPPP